MLSRCSSLLSLSLETDMTTDSFMQYTETTAAQEIEVTVGQSHR